MQVALQVLKTTLGTILEKKITAFYSTNQKVTLNSTRERCPGSPGCRGASGPQASIAEDNIS